MKYVSPNFTIEQLCFDPLAEHHRIKQQFNPSEQVISQIVETANLLLEPMYRMFGNDLQIIGLYRCEALDMLYTGEPTKTMHVYGRAVDFRVRGWSMQTLFDHCRTHLDFHYLHGEFAAPDNPGRGWLHASYVTNIPLKRIARFEMIRPYWVDYEEKGTE